jgi:hypothetical protein
VYQGCGKRGERDGSIRSAGAKAIWAVFVLGVGVEKRVTVGRRSLGNANG